MSTPGTASSSASEPFVRSGSPSTTGSPLAHNVAFWMRAYPRRWRAVRGDELAGLVLDLAAPGADQLGGRDALDLVRGGWATRWREHPPVHTWLLYRMVNRRIPARYRAWALDDIMGFWFPTRSYLGNMAWLVPYVLFVSQGPAGGFAPWFALLAVVLAFASLFLSSESQRRQILVKHVAPHPGEPLVAGALVLHPVPCTRASATSWLTWAAVLLALAGAASAMTSLLAPKALIFQAMPEDSGAMAGTTESFVGPVGDGRTIAFLILTAALALGLLGAAVAGARLQRLLGRRVEQPHRSVRPITVKQRFRVVFWCVMIAVLAWLEVSGHLVLGPSLLLGAVALVGLPGVLVARVLVHRSNCHDLSGTDVRCMALRGRVPAIDPLVFVLRPLSGPVPDGVVVPWPVDPPCPALP